MTLKGHVQDLSSLGFPSLNSACITGTIDTEVERLKQEVMQCEHKFGLVDGAEKYNSNLEKMNERDGTNNMCQYDHPEYGRKIWRWWESSKHRFTHIKKAVKLMELM